MPNQSATARNHPKMTMPRSQILVSSLGLLCAAATPAIGCELCAIYAGSHGGGVEQHGWFTGVAEQFTTFGGLQLGGTEIANPANQSVETSTTQFILGYNFNDHFSLQANIPYIHRSFRRPNGPGIEEGTEAGLGDAILLGKLLLLRKDTEDSSFTWSLLAGVKFPTGSTSQLREETQALSRLVNSGGGTHGITHSGTMNGITTESGIHGFDLTLGSGSFDARVGTSVFYRHKRAFFNAAVQYAITTEGDYGYRFANDLTWDGGPGYYLLQDATRSLALEAAFSGEHKGADTYADQRVDATGFTAVYIGPKLSYTWKDRLSAHLGVDFPVSVSNSGLQAVPGTRVRAGFTWLLGSSSEPAAGAQEKPRSVAMDGSAPPIWTPAPESRFYGGVEYLHWWVKDAPLAIPLVTSGPIASTHHGLLGNPMVTASDTTILYGGPFGNSKGGEDSQAFQALSGTRLTFGYTLGSERRFAIEASGFALQQQSAGYESRGDANGNPVLGIPVYNSVPYKIGSMTIPAGEDSLPYSLPEDPRRARADGIITGGIKIANDVRLWGAEVEGVVTLFRTPSWELSGLVGFRHLDLAESLNLHSQIQGITGQYVGQYGEVVDRFSTRNRFFGGILGLRGRYSSGRLSVDVGARVALGVSDETEDVAGGYYSINFAGPYESGILGVFAQPANEGKTYGSNFAVVPELQMKIGYAITPRLRATIGYDFLYYSNVLRPSEQIDRNIPKGQTFRQASPTISTTSPARRFETTDFFAHGFSFGMEFRF
jgi:hypothetical protein